MSLSQAQVETSIASLQSALSKGELRVEFADRSVTYRSTSDIREALTYFEGLLSQFTATTHRSRQTLGVASRGF